MINLTPGRKSGQKGKIMNCNKTTNFFSELKRLCDSRTSCEAGAENKEQCPLFDFCFCERSITTRDAEEIIKAIEILQKWSDEHPKKTYAQDFFEKFPKAPKDKTFKEKCPWVCRMGIYGGECPSAGCVECWNEPMNDE
jgi:hypothetical protein